MFDWIGFGHSMKKAHISIGVLVAVLIGGTAIVGFDAPSSEIQAVTAIAFIAGFTCLDWLYGRERRAQERAEQASLDRKGDSAALAPARDRAVGRRQLADLQAEAVGVVNEPLGEQPKGKGEMELV